MKKIIALLLAITLCVGLFAGCSDDKQKGTSDLTKAKEYLYSLYVDKSTVTATDLEYPARVKGGNTFFDVQWTVEIVSGSGEIKVVESENSGFIVVDVPEEPVEDIVYKLTATIKDGKKSEKLTYEYTVPKFRVATFEEYVAAAAGDSVVTQGVITGLISKSLGASYNCIYYQDADGGYYAYGMAEDPIADLGLEVGMTIRVTGEKDIYSGTHEIKNCSVKIIDANKQEVVGVDFTEIYKNASALTDTALVYQQSMLVTIKGVEITGQNPDSGYYKFKMGELESYIRISGSTCPLNAEDKAALIAGHSEHMGWIANVTGVICIYNGAFYLTPVAVDAFEYVGLPEKSDAEMIEFEKGNIELPNTVTKDTVIELPTAGKAYTQVGITWAVAGEGAIIEDGKLYITMPESDVVITLTATMTVNGVTETVLFEIKLSAKTPSYEEIVDMAYGLEAGASLEGTYRLYGVITSIDTAWSEQYQNITVTIQVGDKADKLIQCFRLKGEGAADLKVGDAITVEGTLKNYNGTIEFDSGCILIGMGEIFDQTKIVENAYALSNGEKMENATVLVGVISSIDTAWSDQYKNITVTIIVDGMTDYPIMCYRLKGEGAESLAVGDEIAVLGYLKNYNDTIEFDSGCVLVDKAQVSQIRTVLDAYALAAGESLYANKTLTGVITEVNTAWSDQYKNITVTIVVAGLEDYPIECFRLKGEGAESLKVGDVITVNGELLHYVNSDGTTDKIEFNSGCQLVGATEGSGNENSGDNGNENSGNNGNENSGNNGNENSGNNGNENNGNEESKDTDGMKLTIAEAIERCKKVGETPTTIKYKLTGKVIEVQNETYGNLVIEDSTGSILIYGCYSADGADRYDAMDNYPQVGDTITVYGVLMSYKGETPQMKNAWCLSGGTGKRDSGNNDSGNTGAEDTDGMTLTIAEAIERCNKAGETPTTIKYKLTGKVIEVQNETYGNLVIEDSTGSILIYGCYSADGADRYDAMDNYPQVGDTITVYGVLMSYKGETPQMKNAWCLSGGTGKRETSGGDSGSSDSTDYITAPQVGVAFKLGLYQGNNGEQLYFTGKTTNYEWYMATTTEKADAVDMFLEEVDGGYRLYFMADGTKTYLDMYYDGSHYSLRLTTDPTAVYTWNSEYNTLVANLEGTDCYIGTYGTYSTMSCSKLSYISTSFPTHLYP